MSFLKFCEIHRKIPALGTLLAQAKNFIKKEVPRYFPVNSTKFNGTLFLQINYGDLRYHWIHNSYQWQKKATARKKHTSKESLREKCPYSELFWSVFSRIRTEYGEILSLLIPSECEKTRTKKTPNTDTFHAMNYGSENYKIIGPQRVIKGSTCNYTLKNWYLVTWLCEANNTKVLIHEMCFIGREERDTLCIDSLCFAW